MNPIRKGLAPVNIPFPIRTTDRVLARWFGETRRCLQQLEARVPTANISKGKTSEAELPPFWTTISTIPDSEPITFATSPQIGYLIYQNAGAIESEQGVVGYITPTINGVAIDDPEVEPLELPGPVSFVYLRVKTDANGVPKFSEVTPPVTIEAFAEAQDSTHHVRPSPAGGEEDGDYFFLIAETESNGADPAAPRIKRRITGNRYLPNQLVEIENIGGKRELYEGYTPGPEDKHKFRSLEQLVTENAADIIKPLGESEEEGDTIQFRNIRKNNSGSVPYSVTASGDSVNLQFTGAEGSYTDPFGGSVTFAAGLCTEFTPSSVEGWWGQIGLQFQPKGGGSFQTLTIDVEGGVITNVVSSQGSAGAGTEDDPEIVLFSWGDT